MKDDVIYRQAAIKAIEDLQDCYNGFSDTYDKACIIGALEEVPSAQPEQRWIPCNDRYPDMDERVLVYTVAHEYHVWDCMSNRADNYFWEDEEGLYHNKYVVDMWLPLPEPYEEENR